MAVVLPFPALRYDAARVGGLERVLTQPYDKITPEMQRDYLARSPYNLANLVKGESKPDDTATENVYTRGARTLRKWQAEGVLRQRPGPAFYVYHQRFCPPGEPGSTPRIRKGFIGLGRLEQYAGGVVFRHEQTLSAPKADRLELLRATRAHLESIMMLYSDPGRRLEAMLDEHTLGQPSASVPDEYGVLHTLWDIDDAAILQLLQQEMESKKLIIADGHHRYETALTFERECSARHPGAPQDCSYALMTYINMDGEGITILPTHRVMTGLAGWDPASFLRKAEQYFRISRLPFGDSSDKQQAVQLRHIISHAPAPAFGAFLHGEDAFYSLEAKPDLPWDSLLPDLSTAQRLLNVNILHRIAFARCLGIDEAAVQKERHLAYIRDFDEAVGAVQRGAAQACFLLTPVRIEQVRDIAFAGGTLPQKSTDFYPKLLSGLAMYSLQH
jgi:uncharacterized protein (DUF1015 family)